MADGFLSYVPQSDSVAHRMLQLLRRLPAGRWTSAELSIELDVRSNLLQGCLATPMSYGLVSFVRNPADGSKHWAAGPNFAAWRRHYAPAVGDMTPPPAAAPAAEPAPAPLAASPATLPPWPAPPAPPPRPLSVTQTPAVPSPAPAQAAAPQPADIVQASTPARVPATPQQGITPAPAPLGAKIHRGKPIPSWSEVRSVTSKYAQLWADMQPGDCAELPDKEALAFASYCSKHKLPHTVRRLQQHTKGVWRTA